ncbi:endothelin-converting enzyme 1-like [Actinia tenebrosa]|uniref:Endothelin-converting enzyme 1-like n=1 Tax=Actinia tenebrosa TaxID=6105 RepID=A0A6P8HMP4_ACTTE|nr:endothelin-converting enzyme 1-like [Actinia tenebrosa]
MRVDPMTRMEKKTNWWSNKTLEEFYKIINCYKTQYSAYRILGKWPFNVNKTAEEIAADNGALKTSLKAYYKWAKPNPNKTWLLPGLNYTNEQLFFIGFAQHFCGTSTLKYRKDFNTNRDHGDDKFRFVYWLVILLKLTLQLGSTNMISRSFVHFNRIIGSLANSCEFANAFKCKKYSPMNPINKCYLWSKEGTLN